MDVLSMKNKKNIMISYSVRNGAALDEVNKSLGRKRHDTAHSHPVKDASLTGCGVFTGGIPMLPSDTSLTGCTDKSKRYKLMISHSLTSKFSNN